MGTLVYASNFNVLVYADDNSGIHNAIGLMLNELQNDSNANIYFYGEVTFDE